MRTTFFMGAFAIFCNSIFGQTGTTCSDAIAIASSTTCSPVSQTATSLDTWFSWIANTEWASVTILSQKFGLNVPHIHHITVYKGTCVGLIPIGEDELAQFIDGEELDVDVSGLTVGATYYLQVQQNSVKQTCDKTGCMSGFATFSICIEDESLFIPPDFGTEAPSMDHAYLTNKGQVMDTDGNIRVDLRSYSFLSNPITYVQDDRASFVFARIDTTGNEEDSLRKVDLSFGGMSSGTKTFRTERVESDFNFYKESVPRGILDAQGYSRVVINDIYPEIDVHFYSNCEGVKMYFIVRPGGDPDDISMNFHGGSTSVTPTNGLLMETDLGKIEFERAHVYRINPAGNVVPMPSSGDFVELGTGKYTIDVGPYPKSPLIIQIDQGHCAAAPPANLEWSTFFGGSGFDLFYDVESNSAEDVWVTGMSMSSNYPVMSAFQGANGGSMDVILTKFNSLGQLQFSTYWGGSEDDSDFANDLHGLAVDDLGNAFVVTGTYSNDLPLFDPGASGYFGSSNPDPLASVMIGRFDDSGILTWGTYFGSSVLLGGTAKGRECVLDNMGNLYVVGELTAAPIVVSGPGIYGSASGTGFISKFDASTAELLWSTQYECRAISGVAVDGNNNVIIAGSTDASEPTPLVDPGGGAYFQSTYGGSVSDGFVSKFNAMNGLVWSTYFGGNSWDQVFDVATDDNDRIFICGTTRSTGAFPLQDLGGASHFQGAFQGEGSTTLGYMWGDAFLARFNSSNALEASSYVGGSADEVGWAMDVDQNNNVYLAGATTSGLNFPFPTPNLPGAFVQSVLTDGNDNDTDGYLFVVNSSFENVWTTYFGGDFSEEVHDVDAGAAKLHLCGATGAPANFPLSDFGGGAWYDDVMTVVDGFISRLDLLSLPLSENEIMTGPGFDIYPNPANDRVILDLTGINQNDAAVQIYDASGRIIMTLANLNGAVHDIDVSGLSNGLYVLSVQTNGHVATYKLVIEH